MKNPDSRKCLLILLAIAGFVLLLYIGLYVVALSFREPAANMAYFVYAGPNWFHDAQYYFFWPINHLHYYLFSRDSVFAISFHNWDRDFARSFYPPAEMSNVGY